MGDYTIINTIRHGETDYNRDKRYAGTINVPLNEAGVRDTLEASKKLKSIDTKFDVVITSTLKRAIETGRLLLGENTQLVKCQLCNERNYGRMQGLTEDEVKLIKPKIKYINVNGDSHSLNPPQGETFEELRERAGQFYRSIFREYQGLNILIVSHGVFLQQFHGLIRHKSWIESLATYPSNLELRSFRFKGSRLLSESSIKLPDRKQMSW